MRLDIKGMEDINSTISNRLVAKFSEILGEEQVKQIYSQILKMPKHESASHRIQNFWRAKRSS